ncbi:MAG: metallophosphoesterase family protein [Clostridiales bacterium]|nr:metallophosphoesterase family protein [Clostridiales bacterium]
MNSYPKYNPDTKKYEIYTLEELVTMSSGWTEGMPKYGTYVLMNDIDMKGYNDFIPIGHKRERAFVGTFDGNNHCIKNLKIDSDQKYVALFKYLGNKEGGYACVRNLRMENCDIKGSRNVACIAGVNYGRIENCFVSGKVRCDSMVGSHGVGGISGKNKAYGFIKNCIVNADIEGSYDVGGISGIQEEGGVVVGCLVVGTLKANDGNGMVGGIVGSSNAGNCIRKCLVAVNSISGKRYVGKIIGQFNDESCDNIRDNMVWEGIQILGNEGGVIEVKSMSVYSVKDYIKRRYGKEWDITSLIDLPMRMDLPIITSVPVSRISSKGELVIKARVLPHNDNYKVNVYYWSSFNKFIRIADMKKVNGEYKCVIKGLSRSKRVYYYIRVEGDPEITWPYYKEEPVCVNVGDYGIQKRPSQITLTMGNDINNVGVNWITHSTIEDTVLWHKKKGSSDWVETLGVSHEMKKSELKSHKVRMENLEPDTVYQYKVGDKYGHDSGLLEFKTVPKNEFSFLFIADPQAVSRKDYVTFRKCMDSATKNFTPDFIVNAGDITQNGYKATEWKACFDMLSEYFNRFLTISIPGNHENKGDPYFSQYVNRFFMPKTKLAIPSRGTIGEFKCGIAHIVTVNTEIMRETGVREKQISWMKNIFKKSDCKWKILVLHRGMYMVNHSSKKIRKYFEGVLEEVGVNLVLNGHDHIYTRATNNGITYITGGTCGNKFYEYINEENLNIDVWRDDKGCQTYSIVKVNEGAINIDVYSKKDEDDWDNWILIDKVEIK